MRRLHGHGRGCEQVNAVPQVYANCRGYIPVRCEIALTPIYVAERLRRNKIGQTITYGFLSGVMRAQFAGVVKRKLGRESAPCS
jgi:hypothetical protein